MKTVLQIVALCLVAFAAYRVGYSAGGSAMYSAVTTQYRTDRASFEANIKSLEDLERKIADLKSIEAQATER